MDVDVSPDGKTIVFSRSVNSSDARPWLHAELWALDVATLATRRANVIDMIVRFVRR